MKKNILKNDTMNESQLRKIHNLPLYPRDSKKLSDKGFMKRVILENLDFENYKAIRGESKSGR